MDEEKYVFLCRSLAKATSAGVRIFKNGSCICYYSVFHLSPDPVAIYLPQLLDRAHIAGVITTPLYQFYGFLEIEPDLRIIIGPTRPEQNDANLLSEQLFLLGVVPERHDEYIRALRCAPGITAERMGWTIVFLASAIRNESFDLEQLYVNVHPQKHSPSVQQQEALQAAKQCDDEPARDAVQRSYEFEKLLMSHIRHGEPDKLTELFNALPDMQIGNMSEDSLRQIKNTAICTATLASRAAIAGGVDARAAFRLSDLYIQKTELLRDISSLEKLRCDIIIDYAQQVRQIRYHITLPAGSPDNRLFLLCADYVSKNIYNQIRAQELADALGYARTYLCHRFRVQTGMTLSSYVLQEKVLEAQRMLEYTDKSLCDIAVLFGFSSQSHFQTVFKRVCGKTPMEYRRLRQG